MMFQAHQAIRSTLSAVAVLGLLATTHCGSPSEATPEKDGPSNAETAQLTVQSAAAQQYFATANSSNICQAEQDALNKALAALSSNPSGSLDAFNAAMQAFIKCVSSQSTTTLPPVPGQSCTAVVVNGKVQTSGDCSKCQINQSGDSVSVSCSGSSGDGSGSTSGGGTTTTTSGGGTTTTTTTTTGGGTTGSLPPPSGGGTGSSGGNSCTVVNNNGVITKTGDCSHCTIGADGSVSCIATN